MSVPARLRHGRLLCLFWAGLAGGLLAQGSVRTGLEGLAWQSPDTVHATERALIEALRGPLLGAKDCAAALQYWFDGRMAEARGDKGAAIAAWAAGVRAVADLRDLPTPPWPDPGQPRLVPRHSVSSAGLYLVDAFVVQWQTVDGHQFGLFMVPGTRPGGHRFPLLTYVRGGLAGLRQDEVAWLADQCRKGYAVLAPGLPGQPLTEAAVPQMSALRGAGAPGDPARDATAVVAAVQSTQSMPVVRPGRCALIGLGRGANVALLAAARSSLPACVAVGDASQLNPFRAYWARMNRGENTWPDWATFCNLEPAEQLATMRQRSVAHQAGSVPCPVLLLHPDGLAGSLDEQAYQDVAEARRHAGVETERRALPGAARGFADDPASDIGRQALRQLIDFVYRFVPSDDGKDALLLAPKGPQPSRGN